MRSAPCPNSGHDTRRAAGYEGTLGTVPKGTIGIPRWEGGLIAKFESRTESLGVQERHNQGPSVNTVRHLGTVRPRFHRDWHEQGLLQGHANSHALRKICRTLLDWMPSVSR